MDNNKKKKVIIISVVISILLILLIGGTIAYFGWSGDESLVDVTVSSGSGSCAKLSDNNILLEPVSTKEKGRILKITAKQELAGRAYITWELVVNAIGGLQNKTFVYELVNTTTGTVYNSSGTGNFENIQVGDTIAFYSDELLDYNKDYEFTLYLWIDGTIGNNPLTMSDQVFDFDISCNITGTKLPTVELPTVATEYISNLYTESNKTTVTNNSIEYNYATSASLMNDRLGGTTSDYDAGNIRYYGSSPNNYIYFNCSDYNNQSADTCELWRIIGVFDGKMKIVRNEVIGAFAWDTSDADTNAGYGINDWSQSDLMKLLNSGYESNTDLDSSGNTITVNNSLYWNSGVGKCYIGSSNEYIDSESTSDGWCDFTTIGLKNDETRNLIYSAKWNPHAPSGISKYSNVIYVEDASNSDLWVGKVGLLSISDYGYATDLSLCTSKVSGYSNGNCASNSWLVPTLGESGIWTINGTGTTNAYVIKKSGQPSSVGVSYGRLISINQKTGVETITKYYVKPVVYLNESVYVASGDGRQVNPYKIYIG